MANRVKQAKEGQLSDSEDSRAALTVSKSIYVLCDIGESKNN